MFCVLWHVPIIHWAHHYLLVQCSVPELLILSLSHFWGFFRDPFEWSMACSFQELDICCVYCYWAALRLSLWLELENICMSHLYTQFVYISIKNCDFTSVSPIPIWHHRVHSNVFLFSYLQLPLQLPSLTMRNLAPIIFKIFSYLLNPPVCI